MKSKRQQAIISIISENEIETQDELIGALEKIGFEITQATISRDIRDLRITKVQNANRKYVYVVPQDNGGKTSAIYDVTLMHSLRSVDYAQNIAVIKTYPGLAQAVAAGIDSQKSIDILGCVAGDDTVIVVTHSEKNAEEFCEKIKDASGLGE